MWIYSLVTLFLNCLPVIMSEQKVLKKLRNISILNLGFYFLRTFLHNYEDKSRLIVKSLKITVDAYV